MDTSVASMMFRRRTSSTPYEMLLVNYEPCVSFQTIAEMRHGALLAQWGARTREELESFLNGFSLIGYSDELATAWAEVMVDAQRAGRRLEAADAWIAATARLLNAPLLTHDKDFSPEAVPSITVHRFAE